MFLEYNETIFLSTKTHVKINGLEKIVICFAHNICLSL